MINKEQEKEKKYKYGMKNYVSKIIFIVSIKTEKMYEEKGRK